MAFKVVIGKSAQHDVREVLDWYAEESRVALERFVEGFYARLDELAERPESFGLVRQRPRFRKVKIRRFPYYIVFRVDEINFKVFVAAVIHTKRNPAVWVRRLR
ncbi:MAG TPA: type II toxin-antitoxin system RelE/ParE family toxin [Saprospiraceae bacterium]|nr:type II toxin-antitoxin system RelE/ParE family toxin [Saprospiraceae bacterium]